MPSIGILGAGYVGLATAAGFAARGFKVVCADIDEKKINVLQMGELPFFEEGMKEVFLASSIPVIFTTDLSLACSCDIVFCCVGTPMSIDGSADLSYVFSAATTCAEVNQRALFVIKSTTPPGTAKRVSGIIDGKLRIASNPEFLREGQAVADALKPSRIIIGADDTSIQSELSELYSDVKVPILCTDTVTAELIKYASNSFLATKISFINEIDNLCHTIGANILDVAKGMGLDDRIGAKFLQPGPGYGGGCFPKDVSALQFLGSSIGVPMKILSATSMVNVQRQTLSFNRLVEFFGVDLAGKTIAIWGLAFKPNTDDFRDSPSISLINSCIKAGASITAYDPMVRGESTKRAFGGQVFKRALSAISAIDGADALVIMTDWPEFEKYSIADVKKYLRTSCVVDLRHVLK